MEFYLNIDGNQRGPLDLSEFREMVKNKAVSQEDYAWEAKQGRWIKIKFYAELAGVFEEEAALSAAEDEGFFINVEGKTGGPFPRDAIIKEIERGRFKATHFVWDASANRWLKASEHLIFSRFLTGPAAPPAAKKYYLSKEGARFGPFDFDEVEEKILSREFEPDHFVWEPDLKKWVKLEQMTDLADIFADSEARGQTAPPPPALAVTPDLAPVDSTAPPPEMEPPPAAAPPMQPAPPKGPGRGGEPAGPAPPGITVSPTPPGPAGPPASSVESGPPTLSGFTGVQPVGPIGGAGGVPPEAGPPGPKVGDLVSISIPPPAEGKPPPPEPAGPAKVSVDEVEFQKVSADEDEVPLAAGGGFKVDRSVVLDFSRPSFLRRIAAQIVDISLISLSYFLVALIFSFLDMNPYMPGPDQYYFQQLFWATIAGLGIFYFLVRDAGGASLGKRIMGLRVVKYNDYDRSATLVHSIMRNITLLVPLVNILDIVYAFTDVKGRRVGDRLAGTVLTESAEIDYLRHQRTILDEIY